MNPLGLHIQGQGLDAAGWSKLRAHLLLARYTTVTVLDNFQLAVDIQNLLGDGCVVVHRFSDWEPRPGGSTLQEFTAKLNGISSQDKRIVIMVNCEQGYDSARVGMWTDMIKIATNMGWHLCVGNMASGTVKSGQGSDANDWLTTLAPLLRTLVQFPGHYLGLHEYTSFFTWLVTNGVWNVPSAPPLMDLTRPQWHLGRGPQGIFAASKILNFDLSKVKIIITEGLLDTMNDVSSHYPGVNSYGWRNLIEWWKVAFPGEQPEDVLTKQYTWAWEQVYAKFGNVVGVHAYCYLNASGDQRWEHFRVDNAPGYLAAMEVYHPITSGTLPPPVDPPKPPVTGAPTNLTLTLHLDGLPLDVAGVLKDAMAKATWTVETKD